MPYPKKHLPIENEPVKVPTILNMKLYLKYIPAQIILSQSSDAQIFMMDHGHVIKNDRHRLINHLYFNVLNLWIHKIQLNDF